MITKDVVVENETGLYARPATFFTQKANEYKSTIWIQYNDKRVNAKSLLGVLSLGVVKGGNISIIAEGIDEQEAVEGIVHVVSTHFAQYFADNVSNN
ncbi:MAG: HPr family phosphocarrier protein [Candidatus Improbicoccus devescovinae]|nr:MAG: HPr family phosphocarrier protein [Candidatus Improbicoccus devescovinae]